VFILLSDKKVDGVITFRAPLHQEIGLGTNTGYVIYLCSGLAILLLFIALANYVNMKPYPRNVEGARKVRLVSQWNTPNQLIKQF
jgi:putative ABC transport system permease protein